MSNELTVTKGIYSVFFELGGEQFIDFLRYLTNEIKNIDEPKNNVDTPSRSDVLSFIETKEFKILVETMLEEKERVEFVKQRQIDLEDTTEPEFYYKHSFRYEDWKEIKDQEVRQVSFHISRYGKHTKTLSFKTPITLQQAIKNVEIYLGKKMTKQYFSRIKDDIHRGKTFEDYAVRGNALGKKRYLQIVSVDSNGHCFLECESS